MKRSRRELSIDMERTYKNDQVTPSPVLSSYPKQVWDCLKQEVSFYCVPLILHSQLLKLDFEALVFRSRVYVTRIDELQSREISSA